MDQASWTCPNDTPSQRSDSATQCESKPPKKESPKVPPKTRSARVQTIRREWAKSPSVVAAPGPSLNQQQADIVQATGWPVLVCQDAWRLLPWAEKMYGCDSRWWNHYEGIPDFPGEKWSTHHPGVANNKEDEQERYGLHLVKGRRAQYDGFSLDPEVIHYGDNSGFQALNLALLLGSTYIVLIGFDMSHKNGHHFFGKHEGNLHNQEKFERWIPEFDKAAEHLPPETTIINATPGTAMHSFPEMSLEEAIDNYRVPCDRPEPDTATG